MLRQECLCDYRITSFLSTVPYKYKIKWKSIFAKFRGLFSISDIHSEKLNQSKYILRKLSLKYIPKEITNRDKLGFPVPLDSWLNSEEDKNILKKFY